ncbi:hypothetical protein FE391_01520 [Nonomuraea sp. KC401]|nr:hypothetical protein [Nonomuraea sp. K271]TLF85639.1 hypothetical protein FE391_01520 [Nonomuraea sp. KC401]
METPDDPVPVGGVSLVESDPVARRCARRCARRPARPLDGRPLISLPPGTGPRAVLEETCARAGFAPNVAFEAGEPLMLGRLAARGLGMAILPHMTHLTE